MSGSAVKEHILSGKSSVLCVRRGEGRDSTSEKRSLTIHTSQKENSEGIREPSYDHSIDTLKHNK